MKVFVFLGLLGLVASTEAQTAQLAHCTASIYQDEATTSLSFSLPGPDTRLEAPAVVLRSVEQDLEIRYGVGTSSEFATPGFPQTENTPVHYLWVNSLKGRHDGKESEGIYVLDRDIADFGFNTYLNTKVGRARVFGIQCKKDAAQSESSSEIGMAEPFAKVGCVFARLGEGQRILTSSEGPVQVLGDHHFLAGDLFYGFATSTPNSTVLDTEVANHLYTGAGGSCAMSAVTAPNGVRFLRHITNMPAAENTLPALPVMRLSAQCQSFRERPSTELRAPQIEFGIGFKGSLSKTFEVQRVSGRKAFRLQAEIDIAFLANKTKLSVRLILPSGKILHPKSFSNPENDFTKTLIVADVQEDEVIGTVRLEIQACDPGFAGANCVPADIQINDITLLGPAVFYR